MEKQPEEVWFSTAFMNTRYFFTNMQVMLDEKPGSKPTQEQLERLIEIQQKYERGLPLTRSDAPLKFCNSYSDVRLKDVPEFSYCGGFFVISSHFYSVIKNFNLGAGGAYPITIYQWDRKTPFADDEYFLLYFGEQKTAFNLNASNQEKLVKYFVPEPVRWAPLADIKDRELAVDGSLASEGADLWIDRSVAGAFFLSDRLVKELKATKLSKRLSLHRCKILMA